MKECNKCHTEKDLSEFASHPTQGTQSNCKVCQRLISAEWYQNNKNKQIANATRNNKKYRRRIFEYKESLSCESCGEEETVCLDFHHKNPDEKEFSICNYNGAGWDRVLLEIQKCHVLCANCHRKVHAELIKI